MTAKKTKPPAPSDGARAALIKIIGDPPPPAPFVPLADIILAKLWLAGFKIAPLTAADLVYRKAG